MFEEMDIDIKPYFCRKTIKTWESRLRRLEMKMTVLSPDLVSVSLRIHELSLGILIKKLEKYMQIENEFIISKTKHEAELERKRNKTKKVSGATLNALKIIGSFDRKKSIIHSK